MADRGVRAERWSHVIVTSLALASLAPTVYLVAERWRADLVPWLADLGSWSEETGSELTPAETGAYTVGLPVVALAVAVFAGLLWLRRRSTRRAAAGATVHRDPTVLLTGLAWTALLGGLGVGAVLLTAAGPPNTSDAAQHFVDSAWWVLLTPAGLVLATSSSVWFHRRAHGQRVRRSSPTMPRTRLGGPVRLDEGLRSYGRAMVIEAGFGLGGLAHALFGPEGVAVGDFTVEWLVGAIAAPAMISGTLMVLLLVRPTRWIVAEAFAQPLTKVALITIAGGLVLVLVADAGDLAAVLGVVLVIGGSLVAGVTGLYLQDVGPQPQLGIAFIAVLYLANAFTTEAGHIGLPADVYSWCAAIAMLVFTGREAWGLWARHYARPEENSLGSVPEGRRD